MRWSHNRVEELEGIPLVHWTHIWHQLNHWEWPEEMAFCKPDKWDESSTDMKYGFSHDLMRRIEQDFDHWQILHDTNVLFKKSMTEDEFRVWRSEGWEAYWQRFRSVPAQSPNLAE